MHSLIARQPVLDRYESVFGYQLLSSAGEEEIWAPRNGGQTGGSAAAAAPAFELIGDITEGARAFIKCTRDALVSGQAALLPSDRIVLEMPATLEPDEAVLAACRKLKDAKFLIALADFQCAREDPLVELADIIKLDITASADRTQWLLIRKLRPNGTLFVADKVDKRNQFHAAVERGFSYFQGQFFCRPQPYSTSEITPTKLVYLLVLGAVSRPEINIQEVANTIKHDLVLSYNLLRFLNSARFAFNTRIKSIRHALLLLGQNEIRKWVGLVSVAALGEGGPPILVTMALVRAAFCESLAPLVGEPKRQADYFFLGLLSSIDVLMRRPMRAMLAELPIAPDVGAALMGQENPQRDVLQAVISYEQGNWEQCTELAKKMELKEETLRDFYLQALRWSRELTHREKDSRAKAS
jgi:EAL and modified HD-GYP domain-containing signal transduction protein